MIRFKAKLSKIGSLNILQLPKSASVKLPSRGMVMIKGTINSSHFQAPLEPDGRGSHWFKFDEALLKTTKASEGDTVTLEIEPVKEWPEPKVPADLKKALTGSPDASATWKDITPVARWDWIRWINATKNPETRKVRIEKTFSKFKSGKRNPCCFNRSMCTDPSVSKNGKLILPNNRFEFTGF